MSDNSLFSKHWKIINEDPSKWSEVEIQENSRLQDLRLPPLRERTSWWNQFKIKIAFGFASAATLAVAILVIVPSIDNGMRTKGATRVSVLWERAGSVKPFVVGSILKDGDRVGASVIANEESFAYWAITDGELKLISSIEDIESSRLNLQPGVQVSFGSSFELVAPNQGENLVVVVCPKKTKASENQGVGSLFDSAKMAKVVSNAKFEANDCLFAGFRLRSQQ